MDAVARIVAPWWVMEDVTKAMEREAQAPLPRIAWWQWIQLLSLDAPAVALAWQALLARSWDVPVTWVEQAVLGLTVWLIYVGDRWMDARRGMRATLRHRFYGRHPTAFLIAMLVVGPATGWLALTQLSPELQAAGWKVAGGATVYLLMVHLGPQWWGKLKPIAVAVLFTLGSALVPLTGLEAWDWPVAMVVGAGVFTSWLNCQWVAAWEVSKPNDASGRSRLWRVLPQVLMGALFLLVFLVTRQWAMLPIALSVFGLAVLSSRNPTNSSAELRSFFADLALLLPALGCLVLWS